jgi:hypothetical protein
MFNIEKYKQKVDKEFAERKKRGDYLIYKRSVEIVAIKPMIYGLIGYFIAFGMSIYYFTTVNVVSDIFAMIYVVSVFSGMIGAMLPAYIIESKLNKLNPYKHLKNTK